MLLQAVIIGRFVSIWEIIHCIVALSFAPYEQTHIVEHQDSIACSIVSTICFSIRSILIPSSIWFRSGLLSLFLPCISLCNLRANPRERERKSHLRKSQVADLSSIMTLNLDSHNNRFQVHISSAKHQRLWRSLDQQL